MKNNQSGVIHFVSLIIVLLVLVGVGGYFGYQAMYPPKQEAANTSDTNQQTSVAAVDPTETWETFRSVEGEFRVKHPDGWFSDTCEDPGNVAVYFAPDKESRVKCGSEKGSQIAFYSTTATPTASEQTMDDENYKDQTTESLVLGGVEGKRLMGKTRAENFGVPADTLFVQYFFFAKDRTYIAGYIQAPAGEYSQDYMKEFETMVTETLRFTSLN